MGQEIFNLIPVCMEEVKAIGKESRNRQQDFAYRGIDAVMNALQPVLSRNRVFIVPEVIDQRREDVTSVKGALLHYSILTIKYTFYAPDGSSVSAVVTGEGMDSGDKASNKAMSVAFKYACFQVLCIPTEEMVDPDAESHEVAQALPPEPPTCPICGERVVEAPNKNGDLVQPEGVLSALGCCLACHKKKKGSEINA